ncbi:uncharacterized protein F5Z01DRAFT_638433 [Emericellopsis atlantica]|uniref:Invertebrate defensins family profile domain-containing protein n=1 Tax=Emericellopsis atlantica TaxID=2614577 RepID=A0A9P8CMX5_9HYPO|nr:uncharacterized protein F5Z01DRAFT_638433 [Emericellopsis atlantica]KAG9252567.1 hypothetical protein F5Z01DRAFT_638433 [Emericellopsis atlantica]
MKPSSILTLIALEAQATFALPAEPAENETPNDVGVVMAEGEIDAAAVCYDNACLQGIGKCNSICRSRCGCGSGRCGGWTGLTCICSGVSQHVLFSGQRGTSKQLNAKKRNLVLNDSFVSMAFVIELGNFEYLGTKKFRQVTQPRQ